MRLVQAQLSCAQMGNAVKDQCHSERRSVEPRIMWVVAGWVGAHLGCAPQRVALVYRRAKKWRSTGYKPFSQDILSLEPSFLPCWKSNFCMTKISFLSVFFFMRNPL